MLTRDSWDPQSIQNFITAAATRLNQAYDLLSYAEFDHKFCKRENKEKTAALVTELQEGSKAPVSAIRAKADTLLRAELAHEGLLELVVSFWNLQIERLTKLLDGARQLGYMQSNRSRLE